jgi:S23 ribosomal protein.
MAYKSFEELEVWKRGCHLAVRVYEVLKECRDFALKDQMTRVAVSISSNIAPGDGDDNCINKSHTVCPSKEQEKRLKHMASCAMIPCWFFLIIANERICSY